MSRQTLTRLLSVLLILSFTLSACGTQTPSPAPAPTKAPEPTSAPAPTAAATAAPTLVPQPTAAAEQPIYLSIIWHQHQPVYYKDPTTGIYAKPWVRVHATKDYLDMATMLKQYPDIHVTFNLTPSLIRQLDDFTAGAQDLYWTTAMVPADQLTDDQKQFLLDHFFDTNRKIIARFPRYQELLAKRDGSSDALHDYTTQDYLDLQVLFNLAWFDPDWLAQEPLASLAAKTSFIEADKAVVFSEGLRILNQVIPAHKELQDSGQIEVTMTPFAHPILPLLVNTNLAAVAMPDIDLTGVNYVYGQDAVAQVVLGVQLYKDHFGQAPRGMWPAEGSVAEDIVSMVAKNGIQWMASDEGVLANSLGFSSFTRDSKEVVTKPDELYRPYYVQGRQGDPVAIVFRDVVISDKVGFTYSGMKGELAAKDFINRIHAIRDSLIASGAQGPHLVSVILDGENAWENYDNDGKEFLNALYAGLSADPAIKTVTPSEFLAMAPDQPMIENLWPGSWISHDFSTWIGEDEENRAWQYLATVRDVLFKYEQGKRKTSEENLKNAQTYMYIAEGSDWFWWYGSDQSSGSDEAFDQQYRDTLKQVYVALGETPPTFLGVPIIPQQAVSADIAATGLLTVTVDGVASEGEWATAGVYNASGGSMAAANPFFSQLAYGFDSKHLDLRIDAAQPFASRAGQSFVEVYLTVPGDEPANSFSRSGSLLGFPANRMLLVELKDGALVSAAVYTSLGEEKWSETGEPVELAAVSGSTLEVALPTAALGKPEAGSRMTMKAFYNQAIDVSGTATPTDVDQIPTSGPAVIAVPDLGTTVMLLTIDDPANDDYGPGTYTYPLDGVFAAGNFDVVKFQIGFDEENVVFKFTLRGPIENAWGSPNGLSVQTVDVYIDKDGDGQGGAAMLPGRNLSFEAGSAWDYAITAEGWNGGVFVPGDGGPEQVAGPSQFAILVDPGQQTITIRVPKSILGDNPADWRYTAVVLGQEGYPAGGVMRVRDIAEQSAQWRFGGAPAGATNMTRVIDLVWANPGDQEAWLSAFAPTTDAQGSLTPANFATVQMFDIPK